MPWNTLGLGVTLRCAPCVILSMCRQCAGSICIDRCPDAHHNVYINLYLNHVFIMTYAAPALCYNAYCMTDLKDRVGGTRDTSQNLGNGKLQPKICRAVLRFCQVSFHSLAISQSLSGVVGNCQEFVGTCRDLLGVVGTCWELVGTCRE